MKRAAVVAAMLLSACKSAPTCSQQTLNHLRASESVGRWRIASLHASSPTTVQVADSMWIHPPIALITTGTIVGFDFIAGMNEYAVAYRVGGTQSTSALAVGTVNPPSHRIVLSRPNEEIDCPEFLPNGDLLFVDGVDAKLWSATTGTATSISLPERVFSFSGIPAAHRRPCPQVASNGTVAWRGVDRKLRAAPHANSVSTASVLNATEEYSFNPFQLSHSGAFVLFEEEFGTIRLLSTNPGSKPRRQPIYGFEAGPLSPNDGWLLNAFSRRNTGAFIFEVASGCQTVTKNVLGSAHRWEIGPATPVIPTVTPAPRFVIPSLIPMPSETEIPAWQRPNDGVY